MDVSIAVPLRTDDPQRLRAWEYLRHRYEEEFPGWEIVTAEDEGGEVWNKGQAVNAAVKEAKGELLVIADADLMVRLEYLESSVAEVRDGVPWVVPYAEVRWLDREHTDTLIGTDVLPPNDTVGLERAGRQGVAGGGVFAVRRDAFERIGGMDERFIGWGGEDVSFGWALDTLIGPHRRHHTIAWHLWHHPPPRQPERRAAPASERLAVQYREARGDPAQMREVAAR